VLVLVFLIALHHWVIPHCTGRLKLGFIVGVLQSVAYHGFTIDPLVLFSDET